MYHVIIVLDETRDKSYYYSYTDKDGNIECDDLPPYADLIKARSCYWDGEKWTFDEDKYAELYAMHQASVEESERLTKENSAVPSNAQLAEALVEIASNIDILFDTLGSHDTRISKLEGM